MGIIINDSELFKTKSSESRMKMAILVLSLFWIFSGTLIAKTGNGSKFLSPQSSSITKIELPNNEGLLFWEIQPTLESVIPKFYAQKVNSFGESVWKNDISITTNDSLIRSSHKLIPDGFGGVIITWEQRSIEDETTDVYAQKIDSAGNISWGEKGLKISGASGSQIAPLIASDSKGGVIISWNDSRNDLTNNNWDIYAQHVNSSGKILWEEDGIVISADSKDEYLGKMLSAADGGITLIWNMVIPDLEGKEGYDFYFQKISPAGIPLNAFVPNKFLTFPPGGTNYRLGGDIFSDGKDGFYLGIAVSNFDADPGLYLQHILANGQLVFAGDLGIKIDSTFAAESIVNIQADSLGYLMVSVSDQHDSLKTFKIVDGSGEVTGQQHALNSLIDNSQLANNLPAINLLSDSIIENETGNQKIGSKIPFNSYRHKTAAHKKIKRHTDHKSIATMKPINCDSRIVDFPGFNLLSKKSFNMPPVMDFYHCLKGDLIYRKEEEINVG
jgi:hypothetical protein